jgi:dTDP-glucose 4,6-dehydratase
MENILITGGMGFIGSHLVQRFTREGKYTVYNVDCLTYAANLDNLTELKDDRRHVFVRARIDDMESMDKLFEKCKFTYVINCAAESHVDRSIESSTDFIRTNVLGTTVLLECSRKHGVKRFLQVSTDEVYGSLGPEGTFTEESPFDPRSPYSASKASADLLVAAFSHTHSMDCVITRCTNNYGTRQHTEKLIPNTVTKAFNGEKIPVYGKGDNVRDWIHVTDHCEGIFDALLKGRPGEVYNFSGGNELSNIDCIMLLLEFVSELSGTAIEKLKDTVCFVQDRKGHDYRYSMDSSKAKRELGWSPKVRLSDGLRETVGFYFERMRR